MSTEKHYEKTFQINGVKLKVRKLGLGEFPAFKMIYANSISTADADGLVKAYNMIFSWIEYETLGEWIPAYNKAEGKFIIDKLNTVEAANELADYVVSTILAPLFLNTTESNK